ncbi:hypothetical protein C8F04DRAFT_115416 [Mycena alexandri]|uniref:Uncharacterized protein n=1 Tax=Mycena alexandri TaxID=1745969 RepID=A0AAD6T956_9AGAR|nr:hypothetical protein C8F04DRAFT_115416 [Mycena alexandri]
MTLSESLLIHRNLEVWLSDNEDDTIPHEQVEMLGNTLTTSVPLAKGTEYAINWGRYPGTEHTVFCEIFIPIKGRDVRIATHFMDKDKPETQIRSSFGRVNSTLIGTKNNDWLIAPGPSKKAFVELRIRRAQGTPIHQCVPDPDDPGGHLDDIDIDLIDNQDENKAPFIIFRFNFVPLPKPERNAESSKSTVPRKRKHQTRRQSPSSRSNARKRQDRGHQEPPELEEPPRRPSSPLSEPRDGPAPREGDQRTSLADQLAAAMQEEEALDAELKAQLQATEKRIAEKRKLLGK